MKEALYRAFLGSERQRALVVGTLSLGGDLGLRSETQRSGLRCLEDPEAGSRSEKGSQIVVRIFVAPVSVEVSMNLTLMVFKDFLRSLTKGLTLYFP